MNTNDFSAWATTLAANVVTPAVLKASPLLPVGFQSGVTPSNLMNTLLRQASFVAAAIAQFTADWGPNNVFDDGNIPEFEANFIAALNASDSVNFTLYLDAGTADAGTATIPNMAAYPVTLNTLGFWWRKLGNNATTTPTINVNGLGAKTLVKASGAALSIGDLVNGYRYYIEYDGSAAFRVITSSLLPSDAAALVPGIITTNVPPIIASQVPPYLKGYIGGLTLSNDVGTPNTLIDISAGAACSDDFSMMISAAAGAVKSTAATWSAGIAGGLDTGTIAASTWYHVYALGNPTTGATDALISLSPSAPTMTLPTAAGFTKKRRIGSFFSNASSQIRAFTQNGNEFLWQIPDLTINAGSIATTAASYTALVPTGVRVNALLSGKIVAPASNTGVLFSSLDTTDTAPAFGGISTLAMVASAAGSFQIGIRTNTSGQYRVRADQTITSTFFATTVGWVDTRGAQ